MSEVFTLDNLVDLYTILYKEEFIEYLAKYFDINPLYLPVIKKNYYNKFKQAIIDIYTYGLVSEQYRIYIYQRLIMRKL